MISWIRLQLQRRQRIDEAAQQVKMGQLPHGSTMWSRQGPNLILLICLDHPVRESSGAESQGTDMQGTRRCESSRRNILCPF